MLTTGSGPVVVSEKTLRAMLAIRREKLLPALYGQVGMAESNLKSVLDVLPERPAWLTSLPDAPQQALPERLAGASASEGATLRAALANGASLVLIDGPIKEKVKLSFIKAEGVPSVLVQAYRAGLLSGVKPMVKALRSLGHGDVLPSDEMLEAMWAALDDLR